MIAKQEFIEAYASLSREELLEKLYHEMDAAESLGEHMESLQGRIQRYETFETKIKEKHKIREERIEYLKSKLIPELEYRRDKAVTKRIFVAWGIVSVVILWIFYLVGGITNISDFCYVVLDSLIVGGMCLFAFTFLFAFTLQKNIQDRHDIDKYEHEILLHKIYRNIYFM